MSEAIDHVEDDRRDTETPAAASNDDDAVNTAHSADGAADGHESDKDSDLLSEVDEEQFDDYDPNLEERPVEIDENIAKSLKAAKRKKTDGQTTKKPKEGRRPKKRARPAEDDGGEVDARDRRPRKARATGSERQKRDSSDEEEVNEENLTPEERRRRAIQRAVDDALKNPSKGKRKTGLVGFFFFFFSATWVRHISNRCDLGPGNRD